MPREFTVGQTVYVASKRSRKNGAQPREIKKIGRVWITLSDGDRFHRYDPDMNIDRGDYSSEERCYMTEADYMKATEAADAFEDLRKQLGYSVHRGVTAIDILQARTLLRLDEDEDHFDAQDSDTWLKE